MPAKHPDKCAYPKCHAWSDLIYLEKPLCDRHWSMIDTNPNKLRTKIGLPPYPKTEPKPPPPKPARGPVRVPKKAQGHRRMVARRLTDRRG